MKTSKMPPGLRRYWQTHKRPGAKRRARRVKVAKKHHHVATHHPHHRKHAKCLHGMAKQVISGVRHVKWCSGCGGLFDGERWHRAAR